MGQQSMAGVGQLPNPWGKPSALGAGMGKGSHPFAHDADPFHGMVAGGFPKGKGKGKGKGKEGKEGKDGKGKREDAPREPMPCSRCNSFFVCTKTAEKEGKGGGREHCTNSKCERSLHYMLLTPAQKKLFLAANLAAKEAAAAEARLAATRAEADAVAAAAIPGPSPAAHTTAWVADATVVINDTQYSPLTPASAAAAAGHSDTDVSSPGGEPANPAAWAHLGAYGKAACPPTRDPSPANLALMGGHLPRGPPAAGAAVETVDLLFQTRADAGGSPSPASSQAAGPSAPPAADADNLAASLSAMWPDGQASTQAEMMQWAVNELAACRADALRDKEALRAAQQQIAAAEDQLRVAALGAQESGDIRMRQQQRIAELVQQEADRRARVAELAGALDRAAEAVHRAKAVYNSLLEF